MTHLWVRAETRANETRVGLTPEGAAGLVAAGMDVTVEDSATRVIAASAFAAAGCRIVPEGGWPNAPEDAVVFGLKELPDDGTPLRHRHIMFGHAYKGQPDGPALLRRFAAGGGQLLDLEYLVDDAGRRVAAFGHWAGYAGAAVSLLALVAQSAGQSLWSVEKYAGNARDLMRRELEAALPALAPRVLVIGAGGRVGGGAVALCQELGVAVTEWDMAETAQGGPFPAILEHDVFLNCILAGPTTPVFVPVSARTADRALRVIGDIACDPGSDYNPIPLYDAATSWAQPVTRVHAAPPLDVMAIDNLPSLMPAEASADFAAQLLPHLRALDDIGSGVWGRAGQTFAEHMARFT